MPSDELRQRVDARSHLFTGDHDQSIKRARPGPLTIRTMREHVSVFFRTGQTRATRLAVLRQRQYLPRPERGGGQVLFCRGPWPGLEGAALRRRSVFVLGAT
jgi:hypothetical protein